MNQSNIFAGIAKRKRTLQIGLGVGLILAFCISIFWMIVSGRTRRLEVDTSTTSTIIELPQEEELVSRRLDGMMVPRGQESYAPYAVMVDNQVDARPQSGVTEASVVIETPAEGGITRFLAMFDATTTVAQVGPVRSARPYFVEWARGWNAAYFHVGGSPEALQLISTLNQFANIDEIGKDNAFWRSRQRSAPHNTYTSSTLMSAAVQKLGMASSTSRLGWFFQDSVASSSRGSVTSVRVPYGGSYTITWRFDKETGLYQRLSSSRAVVKDADGKTYDVHNVIVMKTDSTILDDKGRLRVRTSGSGDAVLYRDGERFPVRWRRSPGELIRFETIDGNDVKLTRGKTWINVVTNDLMLGGVDAPAATSATGTTSTR